MGMYTELNIGVEFKKDAPKDIIDAIKYMVEDNDGIDPHFDTSHSLFRTDRWRWMLRSAGSYYFDTNPSFNFELDKITDSYFLSFVTNIKNYTSEWQEFLKFIAPHVVNNGYIGTYRYEEDEEPTLVFIRNGIATFKYSSGKEEAI